MRSDEFIKKLKQMHQGIEKCPNCKGHPSILFTDSGCFDMIQCFRCKTYMKYDRTHFRDVFFQIAIWNKECLDWPKPEPKIVGTIEPLEWRSRSFKYK